jgi:hypothetical protein
VSRIPGDASFAVKQAFEEIYQRLDRLGVSHAQNLNFKGQKITNAGDAEHDGEYVTLRQLNQALEDTATPPADASTASTATPGDGGTSGDVDDGLGAQGCASCGTTGHVSAGAPLTAVTAGQIVCGTAQEFPNLVAATKNQATRDKNALELLLRMIWHLQQAGFTAGRQRNPSGVVSEDKLTVQIEGAFRAYDVFQGVDFSSQMPVQMNQVFPPDYVASAGKAD